MASTEASAPVADAQVADVAAQAEPKAAEPQVRAPATEEKLAADVASLEITDNGEAAAVDEETTLPPHRSHDPDYNQKRSDPFQFGSRFLEEGDDPFEFNAWDHVETDDVYKEYAEQQYEMQRQSPVSDFDKRKFGSFFLLLSHCIHITHQPTRSRMMIYITA